MNEYSVVKFNDAEKYAAVVCGGSYDECTHRAAEFRGIYHDEPAIKFGVFKSGHVDMCQEIERKGGGELYSLLPMSNYSEFYNLMK